MWIELFLFLMRFVELAFIARAVLRPYRNPASRIAWVVVILALPVFGIVLYVLFGETSIGSRRIARARSTWDSLPAWTHAVPADGPNLRATIPEHYASLFHLGETINGFTPVAGNSAHLLPDSNKAIDAMVADMDAASDHIHLLFYIWLEDGNGCKVVEALKRAAGRGLECRAIADGIGSRAMIRSRSWKAMRAAGVKLAVALNVGNPLLRPFRGRIDLRNHRKIVVIDGNITYCGSQNCADPEFRVKPRFAPWVDILARFEGPIARQNQRIFVSDWMSCVNEDIRAMLEETLASAHPGFPAQVIATGPTIRNSAMPEVFVTMLHAARRQLVVTTPYYVPSESMQAALCAAAHRGVETTVVFPARNDSWQVAATSRSYYLDLLKAGVKIYEYSGGLLHAKSLTLDDCVSLIGSANMDRRSFELNYENNILLYDPAFTAEVRARQQRYLESSGPVELAEVLAWPIRRRLWNNAVGMMSPLL